MPIGIFCRKKHAFDAFLGVLFKKLHRAVGLVSKIGDFRLSKFAYYARLLASLHLREGENGTGFNVARRRILKQVFYAFKTRFLQEL